MSAMAGPWIYPKENLAYVQEPDFQKGQLLECQLYDDAGSPQGHSLWDVREQLEKRREGVRLRARLIAVSDPHLKWSLDEGDGADQQRQFHLHLCGIEAVQCRKKKKNPQLEFHTDYFRCVGAGILTEKKLIWFKEEPAKQDIQAEISRLAGQKARKKEGPARGTKQAAGILRVGVGSC